MNMSDFHIAVKVAREAADGDSNDAEIEALKDAVDIASDLLDQYRLTTADVITLSKIVDAAIYGHRVKWLRKWLSGTMVREGTAQRIDRPESGDIRDGFLEITSPSGFKHRLSVIWLVKAHRKGEFAVVTRT